MSGVYSTEYIAPASQIMVYSAALQIGANKLKYDTVSNEGLKMGRRLLETADILHEIIRDCGHTAGDDQKLRTYCIRLPETADILQKITRDCRHTAKDYQRLRTYYTRLPETADILQEIIRNCGHTAGDY